MQCTEETLDFSLLLELYLEVLCNDSVNINLRI